MLRMSDFQPAASKGSIADTEHGFVTKFSELFHHKEADRIRPYGKAIDPAYRGAI